MSLVCVAQSGTDLAGFTLYEANDDWELSPPSRDEDLIFPTVETGEGSGSWVIFNRSQGFWGTILRSDDSPYNDCLPPGEALLLEVFRNNSTPGDLLEDLYDRTADQFMNPFHAIIGAPGSDEFVRFHGSFQSGHDELEPGTYCFRDNTDPATTPKSSELPFGADASVEAVKSFVTEGCETGIFEEQLAADGMRTPRCATVFSWSRQTLHVEHAPEYPPRSNWLVPAGTRTG